MTPEHKIWFDARVRWIRKYKPKWLQDFLIDALEKELEVNNE